MAERDAQIAERRTARDNQRTILRIDHRQAATAVGEDVRPIIPDPETPGLRVVAGGSEDRVVDQEPQPIGRTAVGRESASLICQGSSTDIIALALERGQTGRQTRQHHAGIDR